MLKINKTVWLHFGSIKLDLCYDLNEMAKCLNLLNESGLTIKGRILKKKILAVQSAYNQKEQQCVHCPSHREGLPLNCFWSC